MSSVAVDDVESAALRIDCQSRLIDVRPAELRALGWSWLYIISVFFSYYILRPIRDEMGVAGGVENLPWLFTGTLLGMIAVNPPFAALVATPAAGEIHRASAYRFFAANLLALCGAIARGDRPSRISGSAACFLSGRRFSICSSCRFFGRLMVDVFDTEQRKTAVRLHRRRRDPRRHCRFELNRGSGQASAGDISLARLGAVA